MTTATTATQTGNGTETELDSFGISLPEHWFVLPLHRPDFDRTVDGLRRSWREDGLSRTDQRRCEMLLMRVRDQLRDERVVFVAASCERGFRHGVEEVDENAEALIVVCTFSLLSQADLQTDVRISIPVLYGAFTTRRPPDNALAEITDLEPPEVCALPAGRAVRLRRLYRSTAIKRRIERWFAETFVLPVGAAGELAGVLQFATTNVEMAGAFSELFAGLAETMTFFAPDDPTVMNRPPVDAEPGTGTETETWIETTGAQP